jgi:hypothetical protein
MLRTRVIPALLLREASLVKTVRFGRFTYVGDPCNTVRIFNELEVDELVFLDITATPAGRGPNLPLLADIANECFMPLGYGGGIRSLADAQSVLRLLREGHRQHRGCRESGIDRRARGAFRQSGGNRLDRRVAGPWRPPPGAHALRPT